jgi:hypothetical protein
MTYIYLVENCYNDPNKVYIGKTKGSRKSGHKKTYGNQIEYSLIDEVNSFKYKDWEPLETFWINYFKFLGFEVVNIRKKGGSGPEFQTEETKQKISKSNIGKPKSLIHAKNISKGKKGKPSTFKGHKHNVSSIEKIRKYHLGKKYSKESKEKMSKSSLGKPKSLEHKRNMSLRKKNIPKPKGFKEKLSKAILQYDLEGNFIKEWTSALEAEKFFYPNRKPADNIGSVCREKYKTSYGFIWKFKN